MNIFELKMLVMNRVKCVVLIVITIFISSSCNNDESTPVITGFTPTGGTLNDSIIITGANFNGDIGILFGDVPAPVRGHTSTTISTVVPQGAFPAKIQIFTSSGSAISKDLFLANPPSIVEVRASSSLGDLLTLTAPGQTIWIKTENFSNVNAAKSITFNGKVLANSQPNSYGVTCVMPEGIQTGKFTIDVNGYQKDYDHEVTVLTGGGQWTKSVDFPGRIIAPPACFKIGDFFYYGIGYTLNASSSGMSGIITNEFWKFNPSTLVWTQMPSLPLMDDGSVSGAWNFSFTVKGMGYVSGGNSYLSGTSNDFYQFDPATETWKKMSTLSTELTKASITGFASDTKGYALNTLTGQVNEYNPDNDTWTTKGSFPGSLPINSDITTHTLNFTINSKKYFVISRTNDEPIELWKYDPDLDEWERKKDLPATGYAGFAVEIVGDGYVGAGSITWKYVTETDEWIARTPPPSPVSGQSFSVGKRAFILLAYGFSWSDGTPIQGYSGFLTYNLP